MKFIPLQTAESFIWQGCVGQPGSTLAAKTNIPVRFSMVPINIVFFLPQERVHDKHIPHIYKHFREDSAHAQFTG
jgi:hypothetical protein